MKGIPLQWNEGGGGIRPSPKSSWNKDLSVELQLKAILENKIQCNWLVVGSVKHFKLQMTKRDVLSKNVKYL